MKQVVYKVVAVDVVLVFCLVLVSSFAASTLALGLGLPILLVFNYLFLRRSTRMAVSSPTGQAQPTTHGARPLYEGAAIFLGGTLYGLFLFSSGGLPVALLPILLVPLSLGLYLLRMARKVGLEKRQ